MKYKGEEWRRAARAKALECERLGMQKAADAWHRAIIADARAEAAQT